MRLAKIVLAACVWAYFATGLAATGVDGGFSARIVKERVRKVQRFSCQRPFSAPQGWRIAECNCAAVE